MIRVEQVIYSVTVVFVQLDNTKLELLLISHPSRPSLTRTKQVRTWGFVTLYQELRIWIHINFGWLDPDPRRAKRI